MPGVPVHPSVDNRTTMNFHRFAMNFPYGHRSLLHLLPVLIMLLLVGCLQLEKLEFYVWRHEPFYGGQSLHSLRIHTQSPSILYVASQEAGIYKSEDYGQHWHAMHSGISEVSHFRIFAFALAPSQPNLLYALTGTTTDNVRLHISRNNGEVWSTYNPHFDPPISQADLNAPIEYFHPHSTNSEGIAMLLPESGFYWSDDGGRNFAHTTFPVADRIESIYRDPADPNQFIAVVDAESGNHSGIYAWNSQTDEWLPRSQGTAMQALCPDKLTTGVWYGFDTTNQLMRSTNHGQRWQALETQPWPSLAARERPRIAVSPVDSLVMYSGISGEPGLQWTDDGGQSWHEGLQDAATVTWRSAGDEFRPNAMDNVRELVVDPFDQTIIYALNAGSIFRSIDGGGHWLTAHHGIQNATVTSMVFDRYHGGQAFALTEEGGLFRRMNIGSPWQWQSLLLSTPSDAIPPNAGLFAPGSAENPLVDVIENIKTSDGQTTYLHTSIDFGATWQSTNTGMAANMTAILRSPTEPTRVLACVESQGIYRSSDEGASWDSINDSPSVLEALTRQPVEFKAPGVIRPIPQLTKLDATGRHLWLTGHHGRSLESNNGGMQWVQRDNALPNVPIWDSDVEPLNTDIRYVACGDNGVYRTEDGGANWRQVWDKVATTVAIEPGEPDKVIIGGYGIGLYKSRDAGQTWKRMPGPPALLQIMHLHIEPEAPYRLFITTAGAGIWNGVFDFAT